MPKEAQAHAGTTLRELAQFIYSLTSGTHEMSRRVPGAAGIRLEMTGLVGLTLYLHSSSRCAGHNS